MTTKRKHTPAPWAVHPVVARVDAGPIGADGELTPICLLMWPTSERTEDETLANADLIAAAPALLEALTRLRAAIDTRAWAFTSGHTNAERFAADTWPAALEQADAAIRAATGETP